MCDYLKLVGSTYYFRRVVPQDLQGQFLTSTGKARTDWTYSLRTKDRAEAKRRNNIRTLETDRLIMEARRKLAQRAATEQGVDYAPTPPSLRDARRAIREEAAHRAMMDAADLGWREQNEKDERRIELSDAIAALEERLKGATREMPEELRAFAYILEGREFDSALLKDQLAIARAELRGMASSDTGKPLEAPAVQTVSQAGTYLDTKLVDLWAAERKPVQKGIDTHRAVARWFYERVGRKPVAEITRQDVLSFKAKLLEEGTTPANAKMKLSRLRTLLQWAADNDHAKENVAAGITVKDTAQARNKRVEFDLAALNRIFSSPVYADGARPAAGKGEAAYWLPLLALFTGARLEELGQLRVSDVQKVAYPDAEGRPTESWFIHIREDREENLKLKNAASERDVPVHAELERLGFIRFVAAMEKAGESRLFPKLKPNVYGRLTAKWGEWFGPYLRNECAVSDKRMVFHSFRHTFKQYARHSGMIEGVQRQIMGHSSGDVADDYGSGYPLHRVVEGMAMYRVPGLELSAAQSAIEGA